jgi:hypothetical protein
MPATSIARPSKIYPKLDFCFEKLPSGNPESTAASRRKFFLSELNLVFFERKNNMWEEETVLRGQIPSV